MTTFRYLKFPVYSQAKMFYKTIIELTNTLKISHSLKDQITCASLSVILNIAEGSVKKIR